VLGDAFYNHINHINQDLLGSLILADKNTLHDWDPPSPIKNDQRRNRVLHFNLLSSVIQSHRNPSQQELTYLGVASNSGNSTSTVSNEVFKNESVYSLISMSANWNFGDPYYIRFFSIKAARGGRELAARAFGKGEAGPETVKPWFAYYRQRYCWQLHQWLRFWRSCL
jgi:hypothetical protein